MSKTLSEIAQELKDNNKKIQLIYAFNGEGKTRLSKEFKSLISPKQEDLENEGLTRKKIIYYNAFTEDLFYWNNDLQNDLKYNLKIQSNSFTDWILKEQGQEQNIISYFQYYTNKKLTPKFNENYTEVSFSFTRGDDTSDENIKISKGEESNFVWSLFYALLQLIVSELNIVEKSDRSTNQFDDLEYIFIDDPVSSLDENHLIELAVNLADLVNKSRELKFIITTHNTLFYNVLYNELNLKKKKGGYSLSRSEDNSFNLEQKDGDSNKSFSYHLHLKQTLESAISENRIEKYHFMLLRNLYEKTASFLGYPKWSELLPEDNRESYYSRIINFTSHSSLSNETSADLTTPEKNIVEYLLKHLINKHHFWQE
ncbi:anticodon nuclease [Pasteurella sp. PK-2025]|uniref:anticodon nuclease n=1 Tax=Pasteurella sp. PK-2025 TaxID=3413133 RepID=UPI003C791971